MKEEIRWKIEGGRRKVKDRIEIGWNHFGEKLSLDRPSVYY